MIKIIITMFFVQGPLLTFMIDRYSGLAGPSAYSLGNEFANRITGKLNASENLRGPFHPPMPPTPRKTAKWRGYQSSSLKPANEMFCIGPGHPNWWFSIGISLKCPYFGFRNCHCSDLPICHVPLLGGCAHWLRGLKWWIHPPVFWWCLSGTFIATPCKK